MAKWSLKIQGNPQRLIEARVNNAWQKSLTQVAAWIKSTLIGYLVNGGDGIKGIDDTEFYKFITSEDGLSQLGIPPDEPERLLQAYKTEAFSVQVKGRTLVFNFGDQAKIKAATPHPNTGEGFLQVQSWMEWVFDGEVVRSGFVPRERLPDKTQAAIRLESPLGGLMLPERAFGSAGFWEFPDRLQDFETAWLKENVNRIREVINREVKRAFKRNLK